MKFKTKLLLAGAFVMLMSLLAGAWPLVIVGLVVVAWLLRSKRLAFSPEARGGVAKVAALLVASQINFAAMVAEKKWGIYVFVGAVAMMLLDALETNVLRWQRYEHDAEKDFDGTRRYGLATMDIASEEDHIEMQELWRGETPSAHPVGALLAVAPSQEWWANPL